MSICFWSQDYRRLRRTRIDKKRTVISPSAITMSQGLRYKDKVTIVTGGSRGIGLGIVEVFVQAGAKVVIASNEEAEGKQSEENVNKQGPGEAIFIFCDVTKEDDIKRLVAKAIERFGKLDCLINNAGWHPPMGKIDDVSAEDFRKLLDLNFISYFLMAKYCLPHLRKTKGNIIQTCSIACHIGESGGTPYCSTKGAISAFTRSLAIDEANNGVRVNAFSPGAIRTPLMMDFIQKADDPEAVQKAVCNMHLLGRIGTPEEMGKACLFLAADATFCTGIDIMATGGIELGYGRKGHPLDPTP